MIWPRYFQRKVFQTGPSKFKSPTPCLHCCSREIRRALYQSTRERPLL